MTGTRSNSSSRTLDDARKSAHQQSAEGSKQDTVDLLDDYSDSRASWVREAIEEWDGEQQDEHR